MAELDEKNLQKNLQKHPLKGEHLRTGRIPYPKHVWSPSGGWYAQPGNWRANTAVMSLFAVGLCAITWTISARLEQRPRIPDQDSFYPSRNWSKQLREHEGQRKAEGA